MATARTTLAESSTVDPAEVAFEVLDRLGAAPAAPRFAAIGALATQFSEAAEAEAATITPMERAAIDGPITFTIVLPR